MNLLARLANNLAEQALRKADVKQKIFGDFGFSEGADTFFATRSYATMKSKKQKAKSKKQKAKSKKQKAKGKRQGCWSAFRGVLIHPFGLRDRSSYKI